MIIENFFWNILGLIDKGILPDKNGQYPFVHADGSYGLIKRLFPLLV